MTINSFFVIQGVFVAQKNMLGNSQFSIIVYTSCTYFQESQNLTKTKFVDQSEF